MYKYRFKQIHDRFVDVFDRVPTPEEVHLISDKLPRSIKLLAEQWGWSDTEVRELTYKWINENKEIFN